MIVEHAVLEVIPGQELDFEQAFAQAQKIISKMPGYVSHQLLRCIEDNNRYLFLVKWQTLEDHETGFRQSAEYQDWKKLLHHFYEPFPQVWHFEQKLELSSNNERTFCD